jgi:hypothetical protein
VAVGVPGGRVEQDRDDFPPLELRRPLKLVPQPAISLEDVPAVVQVPVNT